MNKGGTTGVARPFVHGFFSLEGGHMVFPKVSVGVILLKEQKVLLLLRNSDTKLADSEMRLEGTWTLPAGKVLSGETLLEAAKRKVKKEAGLDIYDVKIISVQDDINEFAHYVTIGCLAENYEGIVSLGDSLEHVDYGFFDIAHLPENVCEPSQKIIQSYLQNKLYKEMDV